MFSIPYSFGIFESITELAKGINLPFDRPGKESCSSSLVTERI